MGAGALTSRAAGSAARVCCDVRIEGVVQGIGLRPWLARHATELELDGEVSNDASGVQLVLAGTRERIDALVGRLRDVPPAAARIESLRVCERDGGDDVAQGTGFRITAGRRDAGPMRTRLPRDVPICEPCVDELFDPANRRHRYAFTHCATCGPRASVLSAPPWDRPRTTLAEFELCDACRAEYDDRVDRRFHAESIACPACGPQLVARDAAGGPLTGDPVEHAAAALARGEIVALKAYGGWHLAVLATNEVAVARLRSRKRRARKPFALFVPDAAAACALAEIDGAALDALTCSTRAVVLAPRREAGCEAIGLAANVAPALQDLGLLLPVAPLHHLLFYAPGARPASDAPRFPALVLTSANRSGEPTLADDARALSELSGIADLFVGHDRRIARPCDDSVVRAMPSGVVPIRLARGIAPLVIALPRALADVLAPGRCVVAIGGDLANAPAVASSGEVLLGAHVGDLSSIDASDACEARVRDLAQLVGATPCAIAHDAHPGYAGTALAARIAGVHGVPQTAVQHHHAHVAAVLVDHAIDPEEPVIGLALDGAGFGEDGTVWGGEVLAATLDYCERVAHLERVPLVGGDAAAREPWRMAAMWLARAFPDGRVPRLAWHARRDAQSLRVLTRAAERGVNAPSTSSCGRLFDAIASLLDVVDVNSHESEAATALESLASNERGRTYLGDRRCRLEDAVCPKVRDTDTSHAWVPEVIPASDLVRSVVLARVGGDADAAIARRFHRALAHRLADAASRAATQRGLHRVALAGGCFQNRLLLSDIGERLASAGLTVLAPRRLPPGDGALAGGQAAVTLARWKRARASRDAPG